MINVMVLNMKRLYCYGQDLFHGTEEKLNASCEDFDLPSLCDSKSNAINVEKELSKTLNVIHPIINIPNPSANEMEVICKEEENFPDELIPMTFVAVPPLSKIDKQRSTCVSDAEMKDPLEGYPHNCDRRNIIYIKEEREILSESEIKIEIKKENDDCELSSKVSNTVSVAKTLEVNSDSEIDSIAQETKHLCDRLPTSLEGSMLMTTEDIGSTQSMQKNGRGIEPFDEKNDPLTLNGVSETFKCEAEELSRTENKQDGKEGLGEPITKMFKLKECTVVLERIMAPFEMEAGKHLAFRKSCKSSTKRVNRAKEKNEFRRRFNGDQKYSNSLRCDASIISETEFDQQLASTAHTNDHFTEDNRDKKWGRKIEHRKLEQSHNSLRQRFLCNICRGLFGCESNLKLHMQIHTSEKLWKCEICGVCFSSKSPFYRHKQTHTGEKPFKCVKFQISFSESSSLRRHMPIHTGQKLFKCDTCCACFSTKSNLESHKRTHTGEKSFKCVVCHASFFYSGDLKKHMRSHTGKKRFKCVVCHASFYYSGDLKKHVRTHTGEKPFKCVVCDASFSQSSALKCHILIHTGEKPYKCDICCACFRSKSHLRRHMRTHTGERPFVCVKCKASFTQSGHLKNHLLNHSGKEFFKCDTCSACYSRMSYLQSHMRTHTGR